MPPRRAFHGAEAEYGDPTDEFEADALAAWYESQDIDPLDGPAEPIAGIAADVHRAADRATSINGDPLLWRATSLLEGTGQLHDVVQVLNEVLAPVVLDHTSDRPYPIIRFAQPPNVQPFGPPGEADDIAGLRARIRQLGNEGRQATIARARARAGVEEPGRRTDLPDRTRPPGFWRSLTPEQIEAHAAEADRRLNPERNHDHD